MRAWEVLGSESSLASLVLDWLAADGWRLLEPRLGDVGRLVTSGLVRLRTANPSR